MFNRVSTSLSWLSFQNTKHPRLMVAAFLITLITLSAAFGVLLGTASLFVCRVPPL